ncbi:MAG: tetratricopeptide repeat protein [Desulfobacterium sp.]|nr:tetratricopeptide repeat protein [Desulfobacterium sp.]
MMIFGDKYNICKKHFISVSSFLIVAIALAVYANSVTNEFINWDDDELIVNNESIRSLNVADLLDLFLPEKGKTFQPVRVLSYCIDYRLFKFSPAGYHIHSILLHGFAGVFLFLSLNVLIPHIAPSQEPFADSVSSISPYKLSALFTALLFVVHPVNVEAVTWLSGRKYTLLTFWGFLSFYLFVKSTEREVLRPGLAAGAFAAWLITIFSSPFGIVFPVLFFLYDYCREDSLNPFVVLKHRYKSHIPYLIFFSIALFLFWYTILGGGTGGTMIGTFAENAGARGITMFRILFDYLRNLILPFWLVCRYIDDLTVSFMNWKVIAASLGMIAGILYTVKSIRNKNRFPLFCFGWTFVTWLPVSNLIPISTKMADRYLYLPAVGLFLLFTYFFITFFSGLTSEKLKKLGVNLFPVILIIFFSVMTVQRNRVWQNSETLWLDCIEKEPNVLAYIAIGQVLAKQNRLDEALANVKKALKINPAEKRVHSDLGVIYSRMKRFDLALKHLKLALEIDPDFFDAQYNLGNTLQRMGEVDGAAVRYLEAFRLNPLHIETLTSLGTVLSEKNKNGEAINYFRRALDIRPDDPAILEKIGKILYALGQYDDAYAKFKKIIEIDPYNFSARYNIGLVWFQKGKKELAASCFQEVLVEKPDHVDSIYNLGVIFAGQGNGDAAAKQYKTVVRLKPDHVQAHNNLGIIFLGKGQINMAVSHFHQALLINPGHIKVNNNMGNLYLKLEKYEKAFNFFARVIKIDPLNRNARIGLAKTARSLKRQNN